MADERNFSREHVIVLVLAILKDGATHGYEIMREVERRSDHDLKLQHVTLYTVLRDLERDGQIESAWETQPGERPRRVYRLTQSGAEECERRLNKWNRFARAMCKVIGANIDGQPI